MSNILTKTYTNPIIYNPVDKTVYVDNGKALSDEYVYGKPIMNSRLYSEATKAKSEDPLRITEVFYNNGTEETNFADLANEFYSGINSARQTGDRSKAAAIITSKEYTILQDSVVLGTNEEVIRTGVLAGLFEEISTPNLSGKWRSFANDLKWHTNLPESKSPEPSFGAASEVSYEVPKSGGAVAITDRARQVINGGDVFSRLVGQLQQIRVKSENQQIADVIDAIPATNDQTGVDFGARTSMLSTTDIITMWNTNIAFFNGVDRNFNAIVCKPAVYNEYKSHDLVRGVGGASGPIPPFAQNIETTITHASLPGVTWYLDSAIAADSGKDLFAMDRNAAGKVFRGPSRAYTVTDPDTETEKYVIKTHSLPVIVDGTAISRIEDVYA